MCRNDFGFHLQLFLQTGDFLQLLLEAHADEEGPTDAEADSVVKPTQFDKKTLTDSEIVGVAAEFILAGWQRVNCLVLCIMYELLTFSI